MEHCDWVNHWYILPFFTTEMLLGYMQKSSYVLGIEAVELTE